MIEAERVQSVEGDDPLLGVITRVFPIYDGHGNMAATLKRSGVNNYSLANEKRYEAWGAVRYDQGVTGSDHVINPKTRYCANLGHSDDGYTGLTYMRARWYDATTGRFISQDKFLAGSNWFGYCSNRPVQRVDATGADDDDDAKAFWTAFEYLGIAADIAMLIHGALTSKIAGAFLSAAGIFMALWFNTRDSSDPLAERATRGVVALYFCLPVFAILTGAVLGCLDSGPAANAVGFFETYVATITLFIILEGYCDGYL